MLRQIIPGGVIMFNSSGLETRLDGNNNQARDHKKMALQANTFSAL